jgi:hypothetical protein
MNPIPPCVYHHEDLADYMRPVDRIFFHAGHKLAISKLVDLSLSRNTARTFCEYSEREIPQTL